MKFWENKIQVILRNFTSSNKIQSWNATNEILGTGFWKIEICDDWVTEMWEIRSSCSRIEENVSCGMEFGKFKFKNLNLSNMKKPTDRYHLQLN